MLELEPASESVTLDGDMGRRRFIANTAALLTATAAGGCAPARHCAPPGIMTVYAEHDSAWKRNFNPLSPPGAARWITRTGMYESLFIWNAMASAYVDWLGTAYEWSDDHMKLTVTTRQGVRWSDGQPFSARDVAYTFNKLRTNPALDHSGIAVFIGDVRAIDDNHVEFDFSRPYTPGFFYLAQQYIVPEHIWSEIEDALTFLNENPVATGPFTRVTSFQTQVFTVERNPDYWQAGKPALQGLRFPAYLTNDQSSLALIHDEIDWAGDFLPAIDRIYTAKDPQHHHYWFPLVQGCVFLFANTTHPTLGSTAFRKALSMGIDRQRIVDIAVHGYSRPADATGLSDAYRAYRDESAVAAGDWVKHDPKRANAILDAAGYVRGDDGIRQTRSGEPLRFELNAVTGWADWVIAAQIISRSLRDIGIDAYTKMYDYGAWFERVQNGTFELSIGWSEEGPDPYSLYRALMAKATVREVGEPAAYNWHRYGSAKVDALLGRFEATTKPDEKTQILSELQHMFVAEAPAIPLHLAPSWSEFNTRHFTGFPSADDPYAIPNPAMPPPGPALVLTRLRPR